MVSVNYTFKQGLLFTAVTTCDCVIVRLSVSSYVVFVCVCVCVCVCRRRSMLPDVVDDFKVKNPGIHGYEAIFFSFYVFFTKFAAGVSLGISTLSLE